MNSQLSLVRRIGLVLALAAGLLAGVDSALAQVRVDLKFRRSIFVRYEPVIATVRITNMTGSELNLFDDGNRKWFGFVIEDSKGTPVPPYNPDYRLTPVTIGPGQSIERSVNITPLYPITEYGVYRVKPVVYVASLKKYFSPGQPLNIEISEGRQLWQQTVGVPEGQPGTGEMRTITLLSHRLPDHTQLYLRIEDKSNGKIFCTHQLGRLISFNRPQIELSPSNTIHVLQNTAPKAYVFTEVGLDGRVLDRKEYQAVTEAPTLRRDPQTGELAVVGGMYIDPAAVAQQAPQTPPPSVGARPVAAPGNAPATTPSAPQR